MTNTAALPGAGRDPLGRRLLIGIILTSSLVTVLITGFDIYRSYRLDLERIRTSIDLIERSYLSTLVNSLWNYDERQAGIILDGMSRLPDMEFVQVIAQDGFEISLGERQSARTVEKVFTLSYPSSRGAVAVGSLVVVASVDRVIQRLWDRLLFVVASNAVKTFLVAGFALLLFHLMVTRHLWRIAEYASSLEPGRAERPPLDLQRRDSGREDSLGRVETALNDMSQRLGIEHDRLTRSEQRFRTLVEGSLQGVVIHDDQKILYANAAAASILGYRDAATLVSEVDHVEDRVAPRERARLGGFRQDRLAGRPAPDRYQAVWLRRDGSEVIVDVFLRRVDWFGTPAIQNTFIDVTARHLAEEAVRRHQVELEDLVAERTEALQRAQDELMRVERLSAIGQVTATVSHELRNPLGTLKSSAATLRRELDTTDDTVARVLERIDRNVDRCAAIIQDMLDFAQVRKLSRESIDLDDWAGGLVSEYEVPHGVSLEFVAGGVGAVEADPHRLEQCLVNLVDNAVQIAQEHVARGRGRVEVATASRGGRIEIAVSDNGPGVSPALRDRIFEPLYSTRTFGIGLGLPLVRQNMQQHDGDVEVRESPGGGASFVLWLPASQA